MKLTLNDGTKIELQQAVEVEKTEEGYRAKLIPDMWAIPGGKIASTERVAMWAEFAGVRVG